LTRAPLDNIAVRTLFERTVTPMLLADDERRYRDANDPVLELLGVSREEVLSRRIDDFTSQDVRQGLDAQWRAFLAQGEQSGLFTLLRPDGRSVDVHFSATANLVDGLHLAIFSPPGTENEWFEQPLSASNEERLTEREREVLTRLALGETGEEVAAHLFISPHTVRRHVANAREKLGARTRAQAIAIALRRRELVP
jgi:PAS domain S-box-containing protein